MLLKAARDAARWQKVLTREETPLFVSVNVSSKQLFRQDLVQEIRHILGQNLVPKGALKLEVTESLVMENPEQAVEILGWLKSAGAELTLDEFGTGYSSLSYLQRFPFDGIKVDQSFIKASGKTDGSGSVIVRSMVAMAHELGLTVVAEGVEDPDTASFLRSIGSEFAQGVFYGEPITQREVLHMLRVLEKSERKLKPRKLFKTRKRDKQSETSGAGAASQAAPTTGVSDGAPGAPPADRLAMAKKARPGASRTGASKSKGGAGRPRIAPPQNGTQPPPVASGNGSVGPNGNPANRPPAPQPPPPPPAAAPKGVKPPPLPPASSATGMPGKPTGNGRQNGTRPAPGTLPLSQTPPPMPDLKAGGAKDASPQSPPNTNGGASAGPPPPPKSGQPAQSARLTSDQRDSNVPDPAPEEPADDGVDYSKLPPSIAASLRRLAGKSAPLPTTPPPLPGAGGKSPPSNDKS